MKVETVFSIDPGPMDSAWILGETTRDKLIVPKQHGITENYTLLSIIEQFYAVDLVAVEKVQSYGMAVGADVLETAHWGGRLIQKLVDREFPTYKQAKHFSLRRPHRPHIKTALCGRASAKDKNVRQRIIDIYGGKEKAIGRVKTPGPLHGFKSHLWSALAVGLVALWDVTEDQWWKAV